ncbi:MAG: leucyl/phenylalanyl-tRNA--protein transferase [Methylovulum sp.]|nr:leucyl/phenylalanyl-tRNA--protein transferase [Methylovulum sp.]
MQLTVLNPKDPEQAFPSVKKALSEPDGLLAIGGCLSEKRLLNAYRHGIFPWFNAGEPILWWSPDPRTVLFPNKLVISRSLRKTLRQKRFLITFDQAFSAVIAACAAPRTEAAGTWITQEINEAYERLHQSGFAHSVEAWSDGELVGGLYGVAVGQVFFGESMFHTRTDASKVAFVVLIEKLKDWGYRLVDCQIHSAHLASLGAEEISRVDFINLLNHFCNTPTSQLTWHT